MRLVRGGGAGARGSATCAACILDPPALPNLQLPAPCYHIFEQQRHVPVDPAGCSSGALPVNPAHRYCVTILLPHLGLQLTPDVAYASPHAARHSAALLALVYLAGALAPDCPVVQLAVAGSQVQVPHGFPQLAPDAAGAPPNKRLFHQPAEGSGAGTAPLAAAAATAGSAQQHSRTKKPRRGRASAVPAEPLLGPSAAWALSQVSQQGKSAVQALKEMCDRCHLAAQPWYEYRSGAVAGGGGGGGGGGEGAGRAFVVTVSLPQVGVGHTHPHGWGGPSCRCYSEV